MRTLSLFLLLGVVPVILTSFLSSWDTHTATTAAPNIFVEASAPEVDDVGDDDSSGGRSSSSGGVNGPIKLVTVGGTHYSVGFQVGQAMSSIINSRLGMPDYTNFRSILNSSRGAAYLNTTLHQTTLEVFPELVDELQGVADGAGVAFTEVWMMNVVDELAAWQRFVMETTIEVADPAISGGSVRQRHPEYGIMQGFPRFQRGGPRHSSSGGGGFKGQHDDKKESSSGRRMRKRQNLSSTNTTTPNERGDAPRSSSSSSPSPSPSDMHCTDVFTNENPDLPAWGHNEDSGLYDVNHTYMVKARIYNNNSDDGELLEEFQAYTYAGSVAGKAYQWNHHGLLFSCNALFSHELAFADAQSLPRAIHNRVVLRSRTVEEAVSYSQNLPSTTGYSLNIAYASRNESAVTSRRLPFQFARYRNVEIWPLGKHSVREVYPNNTANVLHSSANDQNDLNHPFHWPVGVSTGKHHFFHCNNYQILNVSYFVDPSSVARMARLAAMPVPVDSTDVRTMLGDTENREHPVYRYGTDGTYTMSTVIFNFDTHSLDIYNNNPKNHTRFMTFPMDMQVGRGRGGKNDAGV